MTINFCCEIKTICRLYIRWMPAQTQPSAFTTRNSGKRLQNARVIGAIFSRKAIPRRTISRNSRRNPNVAGVVKKNMKRANVPLGTKNACIAKNLVILEPFAEPKILKGALETKTAPNAENLVILKTFAQTLFHSPVLFAVVKSMKRAFVPLGTKPAANA